MLMPVSFFTPLSLRTKTRSTVKLPNPCFKTGAFKMPYPRQVQVLFTLRRGVLFIVRSHYLYAIGLLTLFSFRWGIPPILRQQSQATRLFQQHRELALEHETLTLYRVTFKKTYP